MRMRTEKGQPGYISARKRKLSIYTIAEFAVVAALLILGYAQTGSRLNLFTLVAILGCLPACKMLVLLIAVIRYKSISADKAEELEKKAPLLTTAYDMVVTSRERAMHLEAAVISAYVVCCYTGDGKMEEVLAAGYIKETLERNGYPRITVKIFKDYKAFLARAEGMNRIASVDQPDTQRQEAGIRNVMLCISM